VAVNKRTFTFTILGLLVWALISSLVAAYYYNAYNDLFQKAHKSIIYINLGINYGNSTVQWFNYTEARGGDTLLDATITIAEVNYTTSSFGALINSINNVNNTSPNAWIWWMHSQFGWSEGPVACDKYVLGDNETLYWYYEDTSKWPYPTPP